MNTEEIKEFTAAVRKLADAIEGLAKRENTPSLYKCQFCQSVYTTPKDPDNYICACRGGFV